MNPTDTSQSFNKLFEPLTINGMTIPNRIVLTAMHLNYTPQGELTPQFFEFYRERVAGGVGLIIIGGCTIDGVAGGTFMVGAWDDKFIEGHAKFVEAMKAENHDVKIGAQLYHAGRYAMSWLTGEQPVSASALAAGRMNPEQPRALELDEIPEFQQHFADGAIRMKKAGFDTVEVIASAGYLICQFLSPVTNKREDEYGGPLENRVRFGVETIQKTREALGKDYPLFVRIAGADHVPGGHTNLESAEVAGYFEKAGADALNVTGGWHEAQVPQLTMGVPRGTYVYLAHNIRKKVNIPVVACNRINNPFLAEEILRENKADMIGVARGMIADPEFAIKAQSGKSHLIRKCIGCNQGCFDHVFMGADVNCLVNYRAGREEKYPLPNKAATSKKVVVIGAGPAGCEAARIAAKKGHKVVLFEKDFRIGGALHLCAAPPGREEFLEFVDYLDESLLDLGVDVRLSSEVTLDQIKRISPDIVFYATGAEPILPPFMSNAKTKNLYLAKDVLNGKEQCYGSTVIVGGGAVGCETALYIAHQGRLPADAAAFLIETGAETAQRVAQLLIEPLRQVTIVEMLPKIGEDIGKTTRWTMMLDLKRSKVQIRKGTKVNSLEENGVLVESDGNQELIECDNVVIATGYKPENSFARQLEEAGLTVKILGDARSPRRAIEAVEDGFVAAWEL